MSRRILVVAVAAPLMMLAWPLSASASKPSYGCPPSFDFGLRTLEESFDLPKHQAAVDDGVETEESLEQSLTDFYTVNDHNGDGLMCWQTVPPSGGNPSFWAYFTNGIDNNASVPSG
jgi:ABC-type phosphate/phosphonate transport system substrate-binding protein